MRDATLLLTLSAAACIIVPALIWAWKAVQDRRNELTDTDCIGGAGVQWVDEEDGRVPQAAPGSRPSDHAPTGHGASRFDPSRGGAVRALNDGE